MDATEARARFAQARVARLATVTPQGRPHLVPVCFAVIATGIVTAVDAKPKSTLALRRLENIAAHPHVSLLADHYDDDWSGLWWVRVDGDALIVVTDPLEALDALAAKYEQYRVQRPAGPIVCITPTRWTGWAYAAGSGRSE